MCFSLLIFYTRKNVLPPYPLYVACKSLVFKQLLVDIRPLNPLWTPYWTPYFGAFPRFLLIKSHFGWMILCLRVDEVSKSGGWYFEAQRMMFCFWWVEGLLPMVGNIASKVWKQGFQWVEVLETHPSLCLSAIYVTTRQCLSELNNALTAP